MNYYTLLGVPDNADLDTIRSAFRVLARRYHPDAGAGSSVQRFREVLTAYETLSDPTRRRHYDRALDGKRPAVSPFITPMPRTAPAPEPMVAPRNVERMRSVDDVERPQAIEDLIDELYRLWGIR